MNANKTKVQLKLAVNRLKLLQQKKTALNQNARREIAHLIETNKLESARIRVENIIREDLTVEALELLELYTETLLARFGLLESMRYCEPGIAEAVNTIIYAAPRVDLPELLQVILNFFKKKLLYFNR
jgi:vacuolar protein sorting-associated protein IST1